MTQVAKILNKLRIDNDQHLSEMAASLEVSPATLSSIQNGSRNITEAFKERLYKVYGFSEKQKEEFENAEKQLKGEVNISLKDVRDKSFMKEYVDTATMFARDLTKLDGNQLGQIQEILKEFMRSVDAQGGANGKHT